MVTARASAQRVRLPRRRFSLGWLNLSGAALLLALAVVWQLAVSTHAITSEYLPAPTAIGRAIGDLAQSGALTKNFSHTLYVTSVGWVAAGLLGVVLGL